MSVDQELTLILDMNDPTRRHLAEALRRYFIDLRRDGFRPSDRLKSIHSALSESVTETQEDASFPDVGGVEDDLIMLDRRAASRLLGISLSSLDRAVARGEIISSRVGRRRLFKKTDLENL